MNLWTLLNSLPHDFVGECVISILSLKELVNIDSAVISKNARSNLHEMLKHSQPIILNSPFSGDLDVLQWLFRRSIQVEGAVIEKNHGALVQLLVAHSHLVGSKVQMNGGSGLDGNIFGAFSDKVEAMEINNLDNIGELQTLSKSSKLKAFHVDWTQMLGNEVANNLSASAVDQFFLKNDSSLQRLSVNIHRGRIRFPPSCQFRNLTELRFRARNRTDEYLGHLAVHLCHLQQLYVGGCMMERRPPLDEGFTAMVRSNPNLRLIDVDTGCLSTRAASSIAQYCPRLRELCAELLEVNSELVQSFVMHGVVLTSLRCKIHWENISEFHGTAFFSEMKQLYCCAVRVESPCLSSAVAHMRSLRVLSLKNPCSNPQAILSAVAEHCTHLTELVLRLDIADAEDSLCAVVQRNPSLTTLTLLHSEVASDRLLQTLGTHCPRLEELTVFFARLITDVGVVAVAAGCPQIRTIRFGGNPPISDIGIEAIASRCRRLQKLDADGCDKVTEQGVMKLVQYCPRLGCVVVKCKKMYEREIRSAKRTSTSSATRLM
mmetsp:Transcript_55117/g.108855  ORF Transcript_55117/g.108855 Transcript_55117/m.108855 type:complete len:546 (-) Transcript_55117:244-1881(-)